MKKFILASVFVASSVMLTADATSTATSTPAATQAPVVDAAAAPAQSWSSKIGSYVPSFITNAKQAVEDKMVAHPWYSAAVVAVVTVATVKALDYAFAQNEDEDSGF